MGTRYHSSAPARLGSAAIPRAGTTAALHRAPIGLEHLASHRAYHGCHRKSRELGGGVRGRARCLCRGSRSCNHRCGPAGAPGQRHREGAQHVDGGLERGLETGSKQRRDRTSGKESSFREMTGVSVVIAAFNERAHLPRLLDSLKDQTHPVTEVVVVDDGSTDGTSTSIGQARVKLVRQAHCGAARARNAGVRACAGDIVVFIDGDMTASRTFVEALVRPIESGAVGSFTKDIYLGNPENPWARAYARIRGQPTPRLLPEDFPDRWENFRAVRREAFLAVGGYDDVGYGEDT